MKQSITLSKHAVERFKQRIGNEFSIDELLHLIYRELIGWPISYSMNNRDYYILPDVTYVMSNQRVVTLYLHH